jgi:hypothetical protein
MRKLDNEADQIIHEMVDSQVSTTNPDLTSCDPDDTTEDPSENQDDTTAALVDNCSHVFSGVERRDEQDERASAATDTTRPVPCSSASTVPMPMDPAPDSGPCPHSPEPVTALGTQPNNNFLNNIQNVAVVVPFFRDFSWLLGTPNNQERPPQPTYTDT